MSQTKLHEILAVVGDAQNASAKMLDEAKTTFQKKPNHFRGGTRKVEFHDEAREKENDSASQLYVDTVSDRLDYTLKHLGRSWDVLYQLETANQSAVADVVVDGDVLITGAPATFLLGMETRLKGLRELILTIPTLDPSIRWEQDPTADEGVFRSNEIKSMKTEKVHKSKVLYDATPEHPAQIHTWTEDAPVATITTTHLSTMWTPARKSEVLGRVDTLIAAVKKARQRANSVEIEKPKVASAMFDFVLG